MKLNDSKLRLLLYEKKTTQTDFAKRAGISRPFFCKICCGHTCSETTAQKIADTLGVTLEELKA